MSSAKARGRRPGPVASGEPRRHRPRRVERIEAAFDRRPDDYCEVITWSGLLGPSHREIASHLGRSEGSIRTLLGRALAKLAEELER